MHYNEFSGKCDLLSKVDEALIGKKALPKTSFFEDEAKRIIGNEGLGIKQTKEPLLEIVVGPSENDEEWLLIGDINENEDLLNVSPYYCSNIFRIAARRKYYEYESIRKDNPIYFLLRVTPNGFFHLVEPLRTFESKYYLSSIMSQILDMLLYCIQMMKYQKLKSKQSAFILVKNVHNLDVIIDQFFQRFAYSFPNADPEPFLTDFHPSNDWKEIGAGWKKILKELCQEVNFAPNDKEINQRLNDILKSNFYVIYNHDFRGAKRHITLKAIPISDFGFSPIEKKS